MEGWPKYTPAAQVQASYFTRGYAKRRNKFLYRLRAMRHRGVDTFVLSAMNCSPNLSCNASQAFGKERQLQSADSKALSEAKLNKILYVMMSSWNEKNCRGKRFIKALIMQEEKCLSLAHSEKNVSQILATV